MTAPERRAKVAEAADYWIFYESGLGLDGPTVKRVSKALAQALAPLLDEFQAEDEARGAARVREAVEAQIRHMLAVPPDVTEVSRELMAADLHIALDAAEKAAVEPANARGESGSLDVQDAAGLSEAHSGSCGCWDCDQKRRAVAYAETGSISVLFAGGMIVCPDCGNKRCPRATHHDNACTGSNEPGQAGSRYA